MRGGWRRRSHGYPTQLRMGRMLLTWDPATWVGGVGGKDWLVEDQPNTPFDVFMFN